MINFTMKLRATFAALCLAACNASLGDMTDTSDNTDGNTTDGNATAASNGNSQSGGDEWAPCSAANACPDGQFCFNGICAIGCNVDDDCADNQYCATDGDRLCHNKEVTTCPDVPCADGQVCVNGFCSTPPPDTQCSTEMWPDGCESNALCVEAEAGPKCYTFPYCAEDDTCPVGTQGAVCNTDLVPDKDKICLIGLCTEVAHCPADWSCVKFETNGVLGLCSSGAVGFPCTSNDECVSNSCNLPLPGVPGFCN